jgi:hypothetical protein
MSTENKIEYYFLRASAEKFAADLRHFAKVSDVIFYISVTFLLIGFSFAYLVPHLLH